MDMVLGKLELALAVAGEPGTLVLVLGRRNLLVSAFRLLGAICREYRSFEDFGNLSDGLWRTVFSRWSCHYCWRLARKAFICESSKHRGSDDGDDQVCARFQRCSI